ncbi:RHS repeat-associated core domain-containing protein [Micromonospora chalcea]
MTSSPSALRAASRRRLSQARTPIAAMMAIIMAVVTAQVPADAAGAAPWKPPKPKDVTGVAVKPLKHTVRPSWTAGAREVRAAGTAARWPQAGTATVDLTTGVRQRAGALPVWVSPHAGRARASAATGQEAVGHVTVALADKAAARSAGVSGLVLDVRRADGRRDAGAVDLTVSYRDVAADRGGDWASRLRLVSLPDGTPLPSTNDAAAKTVSATVTLSPSARVALAAGASGDNGDYSATSLSAASTWQVSEQTGAFSWSYPVSVPPVPGGLAPALSMSYSSAAVDGLTGGTNTQGSWIGDGWSMWPGYIERKFKACADDKDPIRGKNANNGSVSGGDLCWYKPEGNATVSLNGQATELVKSSGNTWKGVTDDGSKIELATDTSNDNNNEYWKMTTPDGTQYYFGRNHGGGGSSGATTTNSTWTVPVYGNHPDEPGYNTSGFAASRATEAWRWNLDYVVDTHGNTITYFYGKEPGAYGREGDKNKRTTYDRGGYLTKVEYGNRTDAPVTTYAAARVLFDHDDRCVSSCWSGSTAIQASWPDTPWDQYCTAAPCTEQLSPTFWTNQRLNMITTQVQSGTGATYSTVDEISLRHTYLQSGDVGASPMWLKGITRTGKVTTAGGAEATVPEIVFDPGADPLANRVDGPADGRSNLFRYRINTVTTESGAQYGITYSKPECTRGNTPAVASNTKRCFPQHYGPKGEEPTLDWFHKHRVDRIDVYDNTGGFTHEQTNYDYLDTPAWHYDNSELTDEKKRTWSEFRGWGKIRVRTGLESGVQSATEYLYFRGMDDDKQPTGTRDVWITDSQNGTVEDHDAYAGMIREETTLLGVGGSWISGTITTPVKQGPTASSGNLKAWMTNTGTTRSRLKLSTGATRWTKTVTTYNSDNLPTQVDDLGDESTTADDRCTRTWYARNPSTWMLGLPKRTEAVGVDCASTPTLPADMLSSTRTTYDNAANNWDIYLPVYGNVAKTEAIDRWSGTTPTWITTGRFTYDSYGRVKDSYDALDRKTATTYTPATGPVTSVSVKNALDQTTTTSYAPAWNLPSAIVDANSIRTDLAYDGLGHLTKVWLPGRDKATYPNAPSTEYTYLLRNTAATAVTTKTHNPLGTSNYATSITLYDGLLRARQVQTQAPGGGRTLADTVYDSRGLLDWSTAPYYDKTNTPPDTTVYGGAGTPAVPALTQNVYDGAGRLTDAIFKVGVNETTNEKWRTTTRYQGEKTSVTPPLGGVATTTITDARGRTTARRQYKNPADVGSDTATTFDQALYTYTDRDELASLIDPATNTWRYSYDQRGRKIRDDDPDRGTTTYTYDAAGQLTTTKDHRQTILAYTYDDLGRKTTIRDGSITGPIRAKWVYDTLTYGIGKLTSSTRYEPAGSTNAYTNETLTLDPAGRPLTTQVTIPPGEGGLCASGTLTPCSYQYATAYRPNGQISNVEHPAAAGLAKEKLFNNFNDIGQITGLVSAAQIYTGITYNKLGRITQQTLGQVGKQVQITSTIDENTGRVTNTSAIPTLKPEIFNLGYTYDNAGNLTKINDTPAGGSTDTQCYTYDYLRRLTEAWTPTNADCAPASRTTANLGGPAPYWHSYTYQPGTDNRATETQHTATPLTRTYTYPAQGGAPGTHPHAVTTITNSGANTTTATYTYDETGNTKTRPGPTGTQTLTWDPENHLAATQDATGTTTYLYDADGNRLIRKDPTGATLYLPGGTEIRKPITSTATATRYYTGPGGTIATRTSTGTLHWIASDHHGTAETTITSTDLTATRRRSHPFGTERGTTTGSWPTTMDKGFVGGTKDNTGLTHLGAREYDPGMGRFISVDPIISLKDPQQWNGYAYAHHNPATSSDPSGLIDTDCLTISSCPDYRMGDEKSNRQNKTRSGGCWPRCRDLTKSVFAAWPPPRVSCKGPCAPLLPAASAPLVDPAKLPTGQWMCLADRCVKGSPHMQCASFNDCSNVDKFRADAMCANSPLCILEKLINVVGWALLISAPALAASAGPAAGAGLFRPTTVTPRGMSNLGGVISEGGVNAAGGRLFFSSGQINQNDFAGIVNGALMRGDDVHIITGAHGLPDGSLISDAGMYADDVKRFGSIPGVSVHNLPAMSSGEVKQVLEAPGTIIGGFCNSGACLASFR